MSSDDVQLVLDGYLVLRKRKCTFHFENGLLTVLTCRRGDYSPWGMTVDRFTCEALKAVTNNNRYVCFVKCTFANWTSTFTCRPAAVVYGLVNSGHDDDISRIESIEFKGPVVDCFFHPSQKVDYKRTVDSKMAAIYFLEPTTVNKRYSIRWKKEMLEVELGVGGLGIHVGNANKPPINQPYSYFKIIFSEAKALSRLDKYYAAVYKMFSFFHFRRDISFDDIQLYRSDTGGVSRAVAKMIIFGHEITPEAVPEKPRLITYDLVLDYFPSIFKFALDGNVFSAQIPD